MPEGKQIQSVLITLSDGSKFIGTGEATVLTETVKIVDIKFTHPRPLPNGCQLRPLDDDEL